MLATTLQTLIDQKLTTAREIGDLTGVAPSTVYRWIRGESQPDFDAIRLLVRHLPNPKAQGTILAAFTVGTNWRAYNHDLDLDVNQDGCIDATDAIDASINAVRAAGRSLSQVRDASRAGSLDKDKCVELITLLNDIIHQCTLTQQILVHLSEQREKRKIKK